MSFGQRFKITPLQLITAVSSVANDGVLVKPRIVKQIENSDTHTITTLEPENVRQVISQETASKMLDMLTDVVNDGTGYKASVTGYTIAGKTGTSEPTPGAKDSMYVASFLGIAPSDNPELCILVCLYGPKGAQGHQGSAVAAPVVSQMLTEILPYLGIPSDNAQTATTTNNITIPDVRNKTVAEAKKILENLGLSVVISSNTDTSSLVADQMPKPGTSLIPNSSVNIYSTGNEARTSVQVPDLKDMSLSQAKSALREKNLNINASGTGVVSTQEPMAGATVEEGTIVNITLKKR